MRVYSDLKRACYKSYVTLSWKNYARYILKFTELKGARALPAFTETTPKYPIGNAKLQGFLWCNVIDFNLGPISPPNDTRYC